MTTPQSRQPIAFPARKKDTNGHGAHAFSFATLSSNEGLGENLSDIACAAIAQTRAFMEKTSSLTRDNMEATNDILHSFLTGAKQMQEKIFENAFTNTEHFLSAAKDMAVAHRVEDLARLQNDFFQKQLHTATEQSKELFMLSGQIFQKHIEALQVATTRMMEVSTKFK